MALSASDPIPLPHGRPLRPRALLRGALRQIGAGKARGWQATWAGHPHCVGYGATPEEAVERLRADTARRWMEPTPLALEDGKPSAALAAWEWVRAAFEEATP